jgi:hypothetical protein
LRRITMMNSTLVLSKCTHVTSPSTLREFAQHVTASERLCDFELHRQSMPAASHLRIGLYVATIAPSEGSVMRPKKVLDA